MVGPLLWVWFAEEPFGSSAHCSTDLSTAFRTVYRHGMAFDLAAAFREQAGWCDELGSPFTAALCRRAAVDVEGGGWVATLLHRDGWTRAEARSPRRR
jgi:hypothetical protein